MGTGLVEMESCVVFRLSRFLFAAARIEIGVALRPCDVVLFVISRIRLEPEWGLLGRRIYPRQGQLMRYLGLGFHCETLIGPRAG